MSKTPREYYELSKKEFACKKCGKSFTASRWCKNNSFCSVRCSKLKIEPRFCLTCKVLFTPAMNKQKYCSKKCYIQLGAVRERVRVKNKCVVCDKTVLVIPFYKDKRKTCSKECFRNLSREEHLGNKSPFWAGGKFKDEYGEEFNRFLKEKIRNRDQNRCQECFRHQDELRDRNNKKYSLIVHHIDYNKKNNSEDNLIALCRVCHAQTNFNRDNWESYYKERILQ